MTTIISWHHTIIDSLQASPSLNLYSSLIVSTFDVSPTSMVPSGQAFHFDYCVDYAVLPKLRIGAAGYYYTQTTGDVVDGRDVGFHGRGFAIGPAIKYDWGRFTFCVINQFEIATINRPEGIRNWIRVWYAF